MIYDGAENVISGIARESILLNGRGRGRTTVVLQRQIFGAHAKIFTRYSSRNCNLPKCNNYNNNTLYERNATFPVSVSQLGLVGSIVLVVSRRWLTTTSARKICHGFIHYWYVV